jgi:hypothetical protein
MRREGVNTSERRTGDTPGDPYQELILRGLVAMLGVNNSSTNFQKHYSCRAVLYQLPTFRRKLNATETGFGAG